MPKTPDEVKEGLECCKLHYGDMYTDCSHCPYYLTSAQCDLEMHDDAHALIQQLQAQNAEKDERIQQLEAERDAAVADMKNSRDCQCCKHYDVKWDEPCVHCDNDNNCFEWRGVQKEDGNG